MVDERDDAFLGTAVATGRDRRHAFVVMAALVVAFAVTAPLAQWRVRAIPQFVPIYDTAISILDMLAAVLLYAQFEHLPRRSMLTLACAYVFTPLLVAAHALSVPNAYVAGTVIGGEQTTAWLWVVWHGLFPVFIAAYAFMAHTERAQAAVADAAVRRTGPLALAGTVALALAAVAIVTVGDPVMPRLMRGDTQYSRVTTLVLAMTWVVHIAALGALAWYTRLRRVIDTWLAVTLVALTIDVLLSAVLVPSRYQLGYYLGRVYGLLGALFVLGVLLRQTVRLSAMAARSAAALRESVNAHLELARLRQEMIAHEQAARHEAEQVSLAKDDFLATLSHELRTPLSAIVGWIRMLRAGVLDAAAARRAIEVMERNVDHLSRLITDLLDVSRIVSGKLQLEVGAVDLVSVVAHVVDAMMPDAAVKSIAMSSVAPEAPVWVDGDADRLRQVVGNLLSNALKFTPPGGRVTVHLDVVEARARLRVIDTGRGIGAAFLPHMFERFRQAETTSTRSQAGLGLGLAIVRHIVDLHGGSVRAESAGEGKGATFTVALPLRRTIPREAPAEPGLAGTATAGNLAERLDGVRLIVVDDHADSREVVTTILIHAGATVTAVASVADALATMRRTRPDIVICDVAMPGESGFDLIRQIRGWPAEDGDAFRALALTAYARPEDRERALRAGFDAYVSKPAEPRDLVEAVARLAAGLRRAGAY